MKISEEIVNEIKRNFADIGDSSDLLGLLNLVNSRVLNNEWDIKLSQLNYYAFKAKDAYKMFTVQKKRGRKRQINAPCRPLMFIQKCLNIVLQSTYQPPKAANGFIINRNVKTNAFRHVGRQYVYNIDIQDFFPSIKFRRIKSVLELKPFNLNDELAFLIANLCCFEGALPQGAPSSPVLSNIICQKLDWKLSMLARKNSASNTRYADDLTFSSNHNIYTPDSSFLSELEQIIQKEGFSLRREKTRLQYRSYRQEVTGLIVNEKVNLRREWKRNLRAEVHNGSRSRSTEGKIAYMKMILGAKHPLYEQLYIKYSSGMSPGKTSTPVKDKTGKTETVTSDEFIPLDPKHTHELLSKFHHEPLKNLVHNSTNDIFTIEEYNDALKNVKLDLKKYKESGKRAKKETWNRVYSFVGTPKLSWDYTDIRGHHRKTTIGWRSKEVKDFVQAQRQHPWKNEEYLKIMILPFKNTIRIQPPENSLNKLIEGIIKEIGNKLIVQGLQKLRNLELSTDVELLRKGLKKIFEQIKTHAAASAEKTDIQIDVDYIKREQEPRHILKIIHLESVTNKDADDPKLMANGGDLEEIKKTLNGVCYWSIEFKSADNKYRRNNILKAAETPQHEDIEEKDVRGFTHILLFY